MKIWSKEEISSFCLELSLLLKAGLPAEISFSILAEEETDNKRKAILEGLYEKSSYGETVYDSMAEAGVFPAYMLNMVRMGEETGYLESVFKALSVYYEERRRMEQELKDTVIFPIVLLVMMLIVIGILMVEVLPVFQEVFAQLGSTLSPVAMFFLNIGIAIQNRKAFLFVIMLLLIVGAVTIGFHKETREKWNAFWLKKFKTTKAGKYYDSASFASAFTMGVSGGLDTDKALEIAETFCDTKMKEKIRVCRQSALMGVPLAEAIEEQGLLKPMYCRILSVGIKTGSLDSALEEIRRRSEEDAIDSLRKITARVEPTVVIILCIIVGILLLSVMFPLVEIMQSLG